MADEPLLATVAASGSSSIAQRVRWYIDAHPVVRDALAMGIVNLSALTRKIMDEEGIASREAVLAACRRYEDHRERPDYEAGIRRILSRSKLEVRTHMSVITARPSWESLAKLREAMEAARGRDVPLHVIQGSESLTIITDEGFEEELTGILGRSQILNVHEDLVEVNLRSPDVIEEVPGILSFVASTLSERGINFIDVISCYKDNMFIIEEGDLFTTFEALNRLIGEKA